MRPGHTRHIAANINAINTYNIHALQYDAFVGCKICSQKFCLPMSASSDLHTARPIWCKVNPCSAPFCKSIVVLGAAASCRRCASVVPVRPVRRPGAEPCGVGTGRWVFTQGAHTSIKRRHSRPGRLMAAAALHGFFSFVSRERYVAREVLVPCSKGLQVISASISGPHDESRECLPFKHIQNTPCEALYCQAARAHTHSDLPFDAHSIPSSIQSPGGSRRLIRRSFTAPRKGSK